MAEGESPKETTFLEKVRKSDHGYDVYTESALARLAARYESSARIQQITRASSSVKEPKGWRDQFMCMISTRRQTQLHRRDWRSRSVEKERRSHYAKANKAPVPALVLGHDPCSITTIPRLRSLSTIEEHLSAGNRQTHASIRGSRAAKDKLKQKKLRSGGNNYNNNNNSAHKTHPGHKRSSPKKKRERMMTFQLDEPEPLPYYLAGRNEINPTCRLSVLERLVLKGELLLSSLLRPDPSAENLGLQDPQNNVGIADENPPKGNLISYNFAVTAAFNVPITGLTFPLLERRLRVCLFDGCSFLGNIHVFPAVTATEEEDEPWVFVNKGASRCLIQYNGSEELSLYVEVNVRNKSVAENDREASEITCAWAMVDLPNTQEGVDELVSRSSSELPLLVGSMERPVDVNSAHMPSGRSRVLVKKCGEQSAIHLHWYKLSDFQKKHSRLLPETILASNEEVPFLVLYRKVLLDTLLNESSSLPRDAAFLPLIQLYPWMLNERGKQLQEVFKESWIARKLEWPPNTDCMKDKNRQKYLKGFNTSLLTILPLLQSHNVRQPTWPFHSTFENFKLEDPSDIVGKKIDNEIEKSSVPINSTDEDSSSGSVDSESSGTPRSRDE